MKTSSKPLRHGETENDWYRARRLEYLLTLVAGRYISFDEFDIVRREREATRRYILENLHGPKDVDALMHSDLRGFPSLPGVVKQNLIAAGIAVPRLRTWHYFRDVLEVAEAYELESPAELALYRANLLAAVEFEWAHCIVVALEAGFRATGRVIRQPASIAGFLRLQLVEREVPALNLGTGDEHHLVEPIDVGALINRLEGVNQLGNEFM